MFAIGKLAARSGVSADTLRYYEKEGLIAPVAKTAAGYRLFDKDAMRRVGFIKHAKQCGFTLSDIRQLLSLKAADSACCNDVRMLAVEKKLQIEHQIRSLQSMSRALDRLIRTCDGGDEPVDGCPILGALDHSLQEDARNGAGPD